MATQQKILEQAAIGVAVCDKPADLVSIRKPGVAASILRRQTSGEFQTWIDELPVNKLPTGRIITRVDRLPESVTAICDATHVPFGLHRRHLINDIVDLAEQFAELMKVEFLQLRFDAVQDDACRKFHIDAVTARMLCTYRGPGTQYGISTDGAEPKRVFSVPTGAPIILRGTKWPEPPASGLLHRSPPIDGTGTTRFMVVIDPVTGE